MMRRRITAAAATAAVGLAMGLILGLPADAAPRAVTGGGEHPPECVALEVANPDGTIVHVHACGGGSLGESWALDSARGAVLTVDGAYLRGRGCGSLKLPCVVFWEASPVEGQPAGEP
jgi:hypothetical protein